MDNGAKRFVFPFIMSRSKDEPVGLRHRALYTLEGAFRGLEVTSLESSVERHNEVLRRYALSGLQKQMLSPGDIIVAINGEKSLSSMTQELQSAAVLNMKVARWAAEEEKNDDIVDKCVLIGYDPSKEVQQGYLAVQQGQLVQVSLQTRAPAEADNAYSCDYIFGWRSGTVTRDETNSGWLPVDLLSG
mmetsp:Transcript_53172/g.99710  ORF Transcript_53172/g.99710 Transcript_53172/m.99710 type:complete len:188 (-) Transcript_53172:27-590(-)